MSHFYVDQAELIRSSAGMPRTVRALAGGFCSHVINRGNARAEVFRTPADYTAFRGLLGEAAERVRMRVLAYCLMPNHFHLALWPREEGDLSRFMQWLLTTHVRRYHRHYQSSGHVWQGRFKEFPIELLTVFRYLERNPLRAGVVKRGDESGLRSLRGRLEDVFGRGRISGFTAALELLYERR